jgi:small-conductance mechanosensitive channel
MDQYIYQAYSYFTQRAEVWLTAILDNLPRFVAAVLILVVFYQLGKLARKLARKFLERFIHNEVIVAAFSNIVFYFMLFEGLFIALNALKLDQTVTQLLAGAGIIGLALSFAFQNLATNIISGIILLVQQHVKPGDLIETNSYMGVVAEVGLRLVTINTFDGNQVLIPTKEILEKPLKNYHYTPHRRVELQIRVGLAEDYELVKNITSEAIRENPYLLEGSDILTVFTHYEEGAAILHIYFWAQENGQELFLKARSEAMISIRKAFQQHQITIPYPVQAIDLLQQGSSSAANSARKP